MTPPAMFALSTSKSFTSLALVGVAALLSASHAHAQATGPTYQSDKPADALATPAEGAPLAKLRFDVVAGGAEYRIDRLLDQMTLEEKIGQLIQVYPSNEQEIPEDLAAQVRAGLVGSVFYPSTSTVPDAAQRLAIEESRLGIPLLIARDVIHGFRTIFPIPLGQAATWNPKLVEHGARVSAMEARSEGIDWTFAPMVDVCRDARWGRIAETLGEDTLLAGELAAAMVRGFQDERDGKIHGILACGKHYVGYGFSEGGRDYNRVSASPSDLHNVLLPPFRVSVDAGCRTMMTTFSAVNDVPGTAHDPLINGVLKNDWGFNGFVVSDWGSVTEMIEHGYAEDEAAATVMAMNAGVDMDMCSPAYSGHLKRLVEEGLVSEERLDDAVRRILRCKVEIVRGQREKDALLKESSLEAARETARQSVVLLKNDGLLPLDAESLKRIAVIGPMADSQREQLGCWVFDCKPEDSVTPLADLRQRFADRAEVLHAAGAKNTFDEDESAIEAAAGAAANADVALLFIGEDAKLSGEARCRASIDLPGAQTQLVNAVTDTGTPTVLVFLAGRPLAVEKEVEAANAAMFAWHPGTMAGPAITDLLLGEATPSGKLPVTFPRSVGQTPIYYNHPNTGRPAPAGYEPLVGSGRDDLPGEFQYRSHYLDEQPRPLYPFGYGLSYTTFEYSDIRVDHSELRLGGEIEISAQLTNTGDREAVEVVQLYHRDRFAKSIRPVRELAAFRRVRVAPGESRRVAFRLSTDDLGYRNDKGQLVSEPGEHLAWIGGDSNAPLEVAFKVLPSNEGLARCTPDGAATETASKSDPAVN